MVLVDTSVWVEHLRRGEARLAALPSVDKASDDAVLEFIERNRLQGKGLGLIDMHLLASGAISRQQIWTFDARLAGRAAELGLRYL